ncbi:MAG: hypothetical protein LBB77_02560 [Treponema sp.]|jgi:hypothetical protein|nr:hypothetical protein [Treponema sp.]
MKTLLFRLRRVVLPAALILWGYPVPAAPPFSWDLLWSGSWEEEGALINREDLKFHFPLPGLTLRWEILDRQEGGSFWFGLWESGSWNGENWDRRKISLLGGMYHQSTGSRVLYGTLEEWGLAARLRKPWGRGLPFAESHRGSMADLRSSPSGNENELYIYLGSPYLPLSRPPHGEGPELRAFVSGKLNPSLLAEAGGDSYFAPLGRGTILVGGLEGRLGKRFSFSLEGLHTAGEIPGDESAAWFLDGPPLPERNFRLYGLGLLLNSPHFSLSGSTAWSRTQVEGGDFYTSLGIRAGNKGAGGGSFWQFSLAADGAGPRYIGTDGSNPGAGFRIGGKFERQWKKAGFFRVNTSLSGPGFVLDAGKDLGLSFDRSSSALYYRPPRGTLPLRISRISLSASRDSRESSHIKDSAGLGLSLAGNPQAIARSLAGNLARFGLKTQPLPFPEGTLSLSFSGLLSGSPKAGARGNSGWDGKPQPWPVPGDPYFFESFKAGTELSWSQPLSLGSLDRLMNGSPGPASPARGSSRRGNLQIKAGFDYTVAEDDEEGLKKSRTLSLAATLRGKLGRFGVKLRCPDFPVKPLDSEVSLREAWELSLSWRREWR